ncbi:glycosyltransferase family 2 protein [Paenibacillus sp. GCM10023248]|uniref:glycosyltransferase family 2 protein n=1 Tax=unclassified Paenibacillus TaxID=185978 RepID=UPI002379E528|nr:glycosyltransferase family 2 protein [Paenibacillus sp. MAHUQ-63]MDD9266521.1 glycosyltransferase family 2 protein [Paenibacillus sp. MAHUQ-63]
MSKVSVIVPIYNAGQKLHKCIKSIINQTFVDFELILVNDGSTDSSLGICRKYEILDRRIVTISKTNEGSIATRRRGIQAAKSEYIMFVDADDWIDKNTIEILYNESERERVDITVCNDFKVLGNGKLIKRKNKSHFFNNDRIYNKDEIKNELAAAYLHGHPFPTYLVAKLYRKDILVTSGKYLDRIHFLGDDLYYNLEILLRADKVKIINKTLYYYRAGGFTSKYMPYLFEDMINGYQIQKEVIDEFYQDSKNSRLNGISVMLLNTFKTCLYNLFNGKLSKSEIKTLIEEYVNNDKLIECLSTEGSVKVFSKEYLTAISTKNIDFLYNMGLTMYKKRLPRKYLFNIISKIS